MKLFEGEHEIKTGTSVMLTNYRVSVTFKEWWGDTYTINLFLEDISSIQILLKSPIIILLLGGASLFSALVMSLQSRGYNSASPWPFFVVGIILTVVWWFSKKHIISITPNGGKALEVIVKNLPASDVDKFLSDLQIAKLNRLKEINKF